MFAFGMAGARLSETDEKDLSEIFSVFFIHSKFTYFSIQFFRNFLVQWSKFLDRHS